MNIIAAISMARVRGMAARPATKRIASPLVGGLLVLSLAACSSSGGSTDAATASLTTPQGQQQQQPPAVTAKPIAFAPVIGAPAKVSSKMNERLIAAAGTSNIPVASSAEAEYTVRGYLVASPDPKGAKLSYIWDITDKNGKRTKRFQGDELIEGQKGADAWALVDDAAIDRIATATAGRISEWMSSGAAAEGGGSAAAGSPSPSSAPAQQSQPVRTASAEPVATPSQSAADTTAAPSSGVFAAQAAPAPASRAEVPKEQIVAVVLPVTGAPGDGQASLTSAMRRFLQNAGVKLTENANGSTYSVKGSVEMGNADGGQQPITIRWTVVDPSGKIMEKAVVQRNKVPEGSLNGQWGQVAELAASEAAKSVAKLIKPTG
jgi:hypothetical protein